MKKGSLVNFSLNLDREEIDDQQMHKLLQLGKAEFVGFNTNRWEFPVNQVKAVEKIIGQPIRVNNVRKIEEHLILKKGAISGFMHISKGEVPEKQIEVRMLKNIVEDILQDDLMARDSDTWLFLKVLEYFGYDVNANHQAIKELPKPETIGRIRRKFQQAGLYPASDDVNEKRSKFRKEMKEINNWFGEPNG